MIFAPDHVTKKQLTMHFSPTNPIVRLCIQGMALEDQHQPEEALKVFLQAWNEAGNDFEKYLTAHYVARRQTNVADCLKWLQTALEFALKMKDDLSVTSALPALYANIAKCYEELGDTANAKKHAEWSAMHQNRPADQGPFYHGTRADLQVGDFLTPGVQSNYKADLIMNHIYFTASADGAGLAAALAKGDGRERVYIVEPTAEFENDPNVTDKKFPGNPTRSYRTTAPLKITGELNDWKRITPEELQAWREKLAKNTGEIIN